MRTLVFCAVFFIGFFVLQNKSLAQVVTNSLGVSEGMKTTRAVDGTYQIHIPNIKHVDLIKLSDGDLMYIEENRLQNTTNSVRIKDYDVTIMPKSMVDSGVKWAKFILIQ